MESLILSLLVVALAWLGGYPVKWLLDFATKDVEKPGKLTDAEWEALKSPPGGKSGAWLGFLERILSTIVFSQPAFVILGGWFALKLGSKWQTWSSIAKVPDSCEDFSNREWFVSRRSLASWLSQRFLLGTISNVLIGWIIFMVSEPLFEFIKCIF